MATPNRDEEEVDEAAEIEAANAAPDAEVDEDAEIQAANTTPDVTPPVSAAPPVPEKPRLNVFQRLLTSPEYDDERRLIASLANPGTSLIGNPFAMSSGKMEEGARGLLDGASSGFADEAIGYLNSRFPAMNRSVADLITGTPAPPQRTYNEARDEQRALMHDAANNSPATYYGAGLVGAIAGPNLLPKVATKFAPRLGGYLTPKVANAAANGALGGGFNALGSSEAELASENPEIAETAANAATGAVTGGAFSGGMGAIGEALGKNDRVPRFIAYLRERLGDAAERRAVKAATGQNQAFWKAEENKGKIQDIGRTLLDQGIVTAGASQDEIRRGVERLAKESGEGVGETLRKLDAAAKPGQQIDVMNDIGARVYSDVVDPINLGPVAQRSAADRIMTEMRNLSENVEVEVPNTPAPGRTVLPSWRSPTRIEQDPMSLADANRFKSQIDDSINWDSVEPPPTQAALRQMRGIMNGAIEGRAEDISADAARRFDASRGADTEALEQSRLFQEFMDAKKTYGEMAPLMAPALQESIRQDSNRWFSPSDYGMAMSGGLMGSLSSGGSPMSTAMMGAAMGGLNKLARARGPQVAAASMDALAQSPAMSRLGRATPDEVFNVATAVDGPAAYGIGRGAGNALTPDNSNSPASRASSQEGQRFYRQVTTNPQAFGPYADRLQQAAANGEEYLAMQDYLLAADPAYLEARRQAAQANGSAN